MGDVVISYFMGFLDCAIFVFIAEYFIKKHVLLNKFAKKYKVSIDKVKYDYKEFVNSEKKNNH